MTVKIRENVELARYTSLKIGGIAAQFLEPATEKELTEYIEMKSGSEEKIHILGGGSNLLIDDQQIFPIVLNTNTLKQELRCEENLIICSSSVPIRKLLKFAAQNNLGGAEYLASLPAKTGGIVVCNAGRGRHFNKQIADFVVSVRAVNLRTGEVEIFSKQEMDFSYRYSKLKNSEYVVTETTFRFEKKDEDAVMAQMRERSSFSKEHQDIKGGNAGSVFKTSNGKIMKLVSKLAIGSKKGCHFSKKTANWINNAGEGTYQEAKKLIKITSVLHRIVGKKCEVEWVIWN